MSDYAPSIDTVWGAMPLGQLARNMPLAKSCDPETSHEAAASFDNEENHFGLILAALRKGPAGASEIARRTGVLSPVEVNRRLKKLRLEGLVEHTGRKVKSDKNRNQEEYRLTTSAGGA
jgi:predicted Rossmann fold nucleotide-binding protein DprA/Smf involved in DNA uptake